MRNRRKGRERETQERKAAARRERGTRRRRALINTPPFLFVLPGESTNTGRRRRRRRSPFPESSYLNHVLSPSRFFSLSRARAFGLIRRFFLSLRLFQPRVFSFCSRFGLFSFRSLARTRAYIYAFASCVPLSRSHFDSLCCCCCCFLSPHLILSRAAHLLASLTSLCRDFSPYYFPRDRLLFPLSLPL